MGKVGNAMLMLVYLKSGRLYKIEELAERLGVRGRQVRYYREQLEQAGFEIQSIKGRYGGYRLVGHTAGCEHVFSQEELKALGTVIESVPSGEIDEEVRLAGGLLAKLQLAHARTEMAGYVGESLVSYGFEIDRREPADLRDASSGPILYELHVAAVKRLKTRLLYTDGYGIRRWRRVRPYAVMEHEGNAFLLGWCEEKAKLRLFRIARMEEIEVTTEGFQREEGVSSVEILEEGTDLFE